jgi:putative redox protein
MVMPDRPVTDTRQATLRWTGDELSFEAESGSGGRASIDGTDGRVRLSATESLLASIGACTGMDVIGILGKKRQPVARYEVRVRGTQRDSYPRIFTEIEVEHEVEGPGIDPEAVRRSIELSATRYCTVSATVASGETTIHHRYLVLDGEQEHRAEVVVTGPRGAGLASEEESSSA